MVAIEGMGMPKRCTECNIKETTLTVMGFLRDLKVAVYKNNKIYKVYAYPDDFHNIPVYVGQKVEFIYKEIRAWSYDDVNHKTYYFEHGKTHVITVPLSAQGNATLHFTDRYSDWFVGFHGGLGWIHEALITDKTKFS